MAAYQWLYSSVKKEAPSHLRTPKNTFFLRNSFSLVCQILFLFCHVLESRRCFTVAHSLCQPTRHFEPIIIITTTNLILLTIILFSVSLVLQTQNCWFHRRPFSQQNDSRNRNRFCKYENLLLLNSVPIPCGFETRHLFTVPQVGFEWPMHVVAEGRETRTDNRFDGSVSSYFFSQCLESGAASLKIKIRQLQNIAPEMWNLPFFPTLRFAKKYLNWILKNSNSERRSPLEILLLNDHCFWTLRHFSLPSIFRAYLPKTLFARLTWDETSPPLPRRPFSLC